MIPPPMIADTADGLMAARLSRALQRPANDPKQAGASRQIRGMFWYYLAQDAARQGGLGLWKSIHEDMQRKMGPSAGQGAARTPNVESSA